MTLLYYLQLFFSVSFKYTYRFIFIWFVVFYVPYSQAFLKGLCEIVFRKNNVFLSNHDFKNPLSKTLVESYWQAQHLQFFADQNKKQIKQWEKGLGEMIEILEYIEHKNQATGLDQNSNNRGIHSPSRQASQLTQLNVSIETLINKIPQIIEVARKSSTEEALSHRQAIQVVMAVFAKFLPVALKEPDPRKIHWNRIRMILKEIENFDGSNRQKDRFALYKINRVIEKWYSIKEFIRCKV